MRFRADKGGAAAIEFAIVAPVLIMIVIAAFALVFAFWTKNGLQQVAERTARCVAIRSVLCANLTADCSATSAAVCYAQSLAKQIGIADLAPQEVSINTSDLIGNVVFTTVTIAHTIPLAGYSLAVTAVGSFPNNTTR